MWSKPVNNFSKSVLTPPSLFTLGFETGYVNNFIVLNPSFLSFTLAFDIIYYNNFIKSVLTPPTVFTLAFDISYVNNFIVLNPSFLSFTLAFDIGYVNNFII